MRSNRKALLTLLSAVFFLGGAVSTSLAASKLPRSAARVLAGRGKSGVPSFIHTTTTALKPREARQVRTLEHKANRLKQDIDNAIAGSVPESRLAGRVYKLESVLERIRAVYNFSHANSSADNKRANYRQVDRIHSHLHALFLQAARGVSSPRQRSHWQNMAHRYEPTPAR